MKRVSVVGRALLSAGITCALHGLNAKPAVAGTWEPVPHQYGYGQAAPGNAAYTGVVQFNSGSRVWSVCNFCHSVPIRLDSQLFLYNVYV